MKKSIFAVLCGLLAFACSGDKGTDPPVDVPKFELTENTLHLTGVATAIWPVNGDVTLTNVAEDSLKLDFTESCGWLTASRCNAQLASGDTAQIHFEVTMASMPEGEHFDTLKIIDTGAGGMTKYLIINVTATPDSTYPELTSPADSSIFIDEIWGSYCYQFSSAWVLKCRSNSGNPIKVFCYQAWGTEKLEEVYFAERVIAPGDSLAGRIGFSGWLPYPPLVQVWWEVKIGYRVGSQIRWLTYKFEEYK